jgi:hypothetical protein
VFNYYRTAKLMQPALYVQSWVLFFWSGAGMESICLKRGQEGFLALCPGTLFNLMSAGFGRDREENNNQKR